VQAVGAFVFFVFAGYWFVVAYAFSYVYSSSGEDLPTLVGAFVPCVVAWTASAYLTGRALLPGRPRPSPIRSVLALGVTVSLCTALIPLLVDMLESESAMSALLSLGCLALAVAAASQIRFRSAGARVPSTEENRGAYPP